MDPLGQIDFLIYPLERGNNILLDPLGQINFHYKVVCIVQIVLLHTQIT